MRIVYCFLFVLCIVSCKTKDEFVPRDFSKVEIETILEDSLLSVRALEIMNDTILVFPYDRFTLYSYDIEDEYGFLQDWIYNSYPIVDFENDTVIRVEFLKKNEIRSISSNYNSIFLLNTESPAFINKVRLDTILHVAQRIQKVIPVDNHPKAFYDSMDFWNDNEGIAIGDPTEDCMSIIITRDGGNIWTKLSCEDLPKVKDGEAAFAASDTNIAIVGDHTWVATGGKVSRVYIHQIKGKLGKCMILLLFMKPKPQECTP